MPLPRAASTLLAALALLVGPWMGGAHAAPIRVVATTSILGDVATRVGGPDATVRTLIPVGADPHVYAPSARDAAALRQADVVVANGLGLESGLQSLLRSARSDGANVVEVGPAARPRNGPDGRRDPHFWTDPRRMELAAQAIARALAARADPATGRRIGLRGRAFRAALVREDGRVRREVARVPAGRRVLVTNHHVLGYFAHRYGFRVVGAIIPSTSTLATASAADIATLARTIRRHRVPAIFVDSTSPRRLADVLAREAGLNTRIVSLYSESLGPRGSGAESYLGMIRVNTRRIVDALGTR